jgi:hypothetical protein
VQHLRPGDHTALSLELGVEIGHSSTIVAPHVQARSPASDLWTA